MCCFRKKIKVKKLSHDQRLLKDKEILSDCVSALEVCLVQLEDHKEIRKLLFELQEQIRYLSPKSEHSAIMCDDKMRRIVDDIRVASFSSPKDGKFTVLTGLIKDVRLMIAER